MHVHLKPIEGVQADLHNRIHKPKPTRLPSNGLSPTIDLTEDREAANDERRGDTFRFTNSPPLDTRALRQRNDDFARFAHLAVAKGFDQTKPNDFRFNKQDSVLDMDTRNDNFRFNDKRMDDHSQPRADNYRSPNEAHQQDFRFPDKTTADRLQQDQQPENYRLSEDNLIVRAMMSRDQQNLGSSNPTNGSLGLPSPDSQIRGQEVNRSNVNLSDNSRNRNGRLNFPPVMPFDSPRVDFFQRPPLGSQSPRANSLFNEIQQFNKINAHSSIQAANNSSAQRSTFDHMTQATNHISSSSASFVNQQTM